MNRKKNLEPLTKLFTPDATFSSIQAAVEFDRRTECLALGEEG